MRRARMMPQPKRDAMTLMAMSPSRLRGEEDTSPLKPPETNDGVGEDEGDVVGEGVCDGVLEGDGEFVLVNDTIAPMENGRAERGGATDERTMGGRSG